MQTPKEEIRNSLLESAGKLFLRKGFLKTSTVSYTHLTLPTT